MAIVDDLNEKVDVAANALAGIQLKLQEVSQEIKDAIANQAPPSALLAIAAKLDAHVANLDATAQALQLADDDLDAAAAGEPTP